MLGAARFCRFIAYFRVNLVQSSYRLSSGFTVVSFSIRHIDIYTFNLTLM